MGIIIAGNTYDVPTLVMGDDPIVIGTSVLSLVYEEGLRWSVVDQPGWIVETNKSMTSCVSNLGSLIKLWTYWKRTHFRNFQEEYWMYKLIIVHNYLSVENRKQQICHTWLHLNTQICFPGFVQKGHFSVRYWLQVDFLSSCINSTVLYTQLRSQFHTMERRSASVVRKINNIWYAKSTPKHCQHSDTCITFDVVWNPNDLLNEICGTCPRTYLCNIPHIETTLHHILGIAKFKTLNYNLIMSSIKVLVQDSSKHSPVFCTDVWLWVVLSSFLDFSFYHNKHWIFFDEIMLMPIEVLKESFDSVFCTPVGQGLRCEHLSSDDPNRL